MTEYVITEVGHHQWLVFGDWQSIFVRTRPRKAKVEAAGNGSVDCTSILRGAVFIRGHRALEQVLYPLVILAFIRGRQFIRKLRSLEETGTIEPS
jgi:hypothetical protein